MERITRNRARLLLVLFSLILVFYAYRLYDEQIVKTGGSKDNATTFTTLTRVKAARGDILDRNGNLLVSNRASYDLVINHYVLLSADNTNDHLYRLIKRCEQVGIEYTDHFPVSAQRPFTYTLDDYSSAWQGHFQKYLEYKTKLDSDISAPLLVQTLRERYKMPAEWTEEEARKVIGLRYEMDLRNCVASLSQYVLLSDAGDDALSAIVELNIPGLNVEASTVREYNTPYAAHILGYVGAMSPEQWEHYKTIPGYKMDSEVGQDGLEAAYEEYLHGVDGLREDVVTTDGTLVSSRYIEEPKAGANVEVSIDINLQMAAEDKMAFVIQDLRSKTGRDGSDAEGGAVVAMDVKTGQILACASYPSYDPSVLFQNYETLSKDPYKPFYNRALLATYPPGSTYKMSMVVAAMEDGKIDGSTTIYDRGVFDKYAGFSPKCLYYSNTGNGHGSLDAAQALERSCNYFFYDLGDQLDISVIDATAKGLGLGEATGVELPEYLGHRSNPDTKAKLQKGEDAVWYGGDNILTAIGQAENRFTPIQLCSYTSTLANQGTRYKATFLNRVVTADYQTLLAQNQVEILNQMNISDETFQVYSEGMHMVTSTGWGTAYRAFKDYPIAVAGKTGTAETDIKGASDNGAFVCYAPLEDPQIAIALYVEKGGHGSTLATIARSMLDVYFDIGDVGEVPVYENRLS